MPLSNRLLAIDDEPELLALARRIAERSGFQVETTSDPEEFKRLLRAWEPTVVLLDLQMPKVDGVTLLRHMADQRCRAKVILASGFDPKVMETAHEFGVVLGLAMAGSIAKPMRVAELRELLDAHRSAAPDVTSQALAAAIQQDQLVLHYQPLVELPSRALVGLEALVRWAHPSGTLLSPDLFVPIAEREGLIDQLTMWVLRAAIRQGGLWRSLGLGPYIAINLSGRNLNDRSLPDLLEELCEEHRLPPSRVLVELTETAATGDPLRTVEVLTRLRLKGCRLAIDDFGTGYSSLLQLRRLPFSELKIDKSFVQEMARSEEASVIIEATLGLARSLKLGTVAEGVEDLATLERLAALGCGRAQGYWISRPMPAEAVQAWAEGWAARS